MDGTVLDDWRLVAAIILVAAPPVPVLVLAVRNRIRAHSKLMPPADLNDIGDIGDIHYLDLDPDPGAVETDDWAPGVEVGR